jgi:DNA repair photolyase
MPVLPGITDSEENLVQVMTEARAAGARSAHARALWLSDASRRRFLPWLSEEFPALYKSYQSAYGDRGMYSPSAYRRMLEARVARAWQRSGFGRDGAAQPEVDGG